MLKKLNTFETFVKEGFKIERNGEVFVINKQELSDILYFVQAESGLCAVDSYYRNNKDSMSEKEAKAFEKLMDDPDFGYEVYSEYQEMISYEAAYDEYDAVETIFEKYYGEDSDDDQ